MCEPHVKRKDLHNIAYLMTDSIHDALTYYDLITMIAAFNALFLIEQFPLHPAIYFPDPQYNGVQVCFKGALNVSTEETTWTITIVLPGILPIHTHVFPPVYTHSECLQSVILWHDSHPQAGSVLSLKRLTKMSCPSATPSTRPTCNATWTILASPRLHCSASC
jgi:hypothetical protein